MYNIPMLEDQTILWQNVYICGMLLLLQGKQEENVQNKVDTFGMHLPSL